MPVMMQRKSFIIAAWLLLTLIGASAGPAPASATEANDLCLPTANPCRVTANVDVDDMSVIDVGTRELRIDNGGRLAVDAGQMALRAGLITVANNGELRARGPASDVGGVIIAEADQINIAGRLDATGGDGGQIELTSHGDLTVTGTIVADRIAVDGGGGEVTLTGVNVTISGMINTLGGTLGFGGDVVVNGTGNVTLSGRINVEGGDGGTAELNAGAQQGTGNVVLTDASVVDADGTGPGGFGGSIDLDANGDGVTTGVVITNGVLSADGGGGTKDTGGGDGGSVSITAVGAALMSDNSASISVVGARPDGFGGEVEVFSTDGGWEVAGQISIGPLAAEEGGGGDLTVDTNGDVMIRGTISGAGASDVLIEASDGTLTVADRGDVNLNDGGSICLSAGSTSSKIPARVVVSGRVTANVGTIELNAPDAVVISESATVAADGASSDGGLISIVVDTGQALINSLVSARGDGNGNAGGMILIESAGRASIVGRLDVRGSGGTGGTAGVRAEGPISITGIVRASTVSAGMGGHITVISGNDVTISGTLESNGGPGAGSAGGTIEIAGCTVAIENQGELSNLRPNGVNRITGRQATIVRGDMDADTATGRNEFRFNGEARRPAIFGQVQPRPTFVMDPSIVACVECGNNRIEPPEECDDGNQVNGDGCSSSCQEEVIIPGDTNGDEIVDAADLSALIAEIFDGDGDAVGNVGEGFPGSPGADANEDERVTGADIVETVRLTGE